MPLPPRVAVGSAAAAVGAGGLCGDAAGAVPGVESAGHPA